MDQEIILEEVEGSLVGRVYILGNKTSAYLVPCSENSHLFSKEQLDQINSQTF